MEWTESDDLTLYTERDRQQQFSFGQALARYAIVHDQSGGRVRNLFVWTIHHALSDGWSLPLTRSAVAAAYAGTAVPPSIPYNRFVKYAAGLDRKAALSI